MDDFASKLNCLFEVVTPEGRGPYTSSEFCRAVAARGGKLSVPYLSQLRSGRSVHPSYDVVADIAYTFGVSTDYFSDDAYRSRVISAQKLRGGFD